MTREESGEVAKFYAAFADGKIAQHAERRVSGMRVEWIDKSSPPLPLSLEHWRIKPDLPPKPTQEQLKNRGVYMVGPCREPKKDEYYFGRHGFAQAVADHEAGDIAWIVRKSTPARRIVLDDATKAELLEAFWKRCAHAMKTAMEQVLEDIHNQQEEAE